MVNINLDTVFRQTYISIQVLDVGFIDASQVKINITLQSNCLMHWKTWTHDNNSIIKTVIKAGFDSQLLLIRYFTHQLIIVMDHVNFHPISLK